jgi:hypothetical protein
LVARDGAIRAEAIELIRGKTSWWELTEAAVERSYGCINEGASNIKRLVKEKLVLWPIFVIIRQARR